MALFNFSSRETKADSVYDKGLLRYFDVHRLTNKGGTSYQHFFDSILHIFRKALSLNQTKILSGT